MIAQIKSWGNSQGVRLPKDLLESIGVKLNDFLSVEIKENSIVLSKTFKHRNLEERAIEYKVRSPFQVWKILVTYNCIDADREEVSVCFIV